MALLIVALEIVLLSSFILVAQSDRREYRVLALEIFRLIVYQLCALPDLNCISSAYSSDMCR
jgi:formate hydrogenlyase subunit 3/multisubunit Na+/H+ antiporter MnhD subunit